MIKTLFFLKKIVLFFYISQRSKCFWVAHQWRNPISGLNSLFARCLSSTRVFIGFFFHFHRITFFYNSCWPLDSTFWTLSQRLQLCLTFQFRCNLQWHTSDSSSPLHQLLTSTLTWLRHHASVPKNTNLRNRKWKIRIFKITVMGS